VRLSCPDDGPRSERAVNARLEPLTDDVARVRRGFIDRGPLSRDRRGARDERKARQDGLHAPAP
jgi:hypothetical protein